MRRTLHREAVPLVTLATLAWAAGACGPIDKLLSVDARSQIIADKQKNK